MHRKATDAHEHVDFEKSLLRAFSHLDFAKGWHLKQDMHLLEDCRECQNICLSNLPSAPTLLKPMCWALSNPAISTIHVISCRHERIQQRTHPSSTVVDGQLSWECTCQRELSAPASPPDAAAVASIHYNTCHANIAAAVAWLCTLQQERTSLHLPCPQHSTAQHI